MFTHRYFLILFFSICCSHGIWAADSSTSSRLYQAFGPPSEAWPALLFSGIGIACGVIGTSIATAQIIKWYKKKKLAIAGTSEHNSANTNFILALAGGAFFFIFSVCSGTICVRKLAECHRDFMLSARLPIIPGSDAPIVLIQPHREAAPATQEVIPQAAPSAGTEGVSINPLASPTTPTAPLASPSTESLQSDAEAADATENAHHTPDQLLNRLLMHRILYPQLSISPLIATTLVQAHKKHIKNRQP